MNYLMETEIMNDFTEVLAEIPSSLLLKNLEGQIRFPLLSSVDHLSVFLDKCELIRDEFSGETENISQLNSCMIDFLSSVIGLIEDEYGISVDAGNCTLNSLIEITQALYNILILKFRKNLSKFFLKYIVKNKKMIIDEFGLGSLKDVTSLSLKKNLQIKNKESVAIVSNLPLIFRNVAAYQTEVAPIEFLELSGASKYYDGSLLVEMLSYGKICGSFVPKIMDLMITQYDSEIFSDVRQRLIEKITKK